MNVYEVLWETRIAPGATYYSGAWKVESESDDLERIRSLARKDIARQLMLQAMFIRIVEVNVLIRKETK
jgi:hypothetical protein